MPAAVSGAVGKVNQNNPKKILMQVPYGSINVWISFPWNTLYSFLFSLFPTPNPTQTARVGLSLAILNASWTARPLRKRLGGVFAVDEGSRSSRVATLYPLTCKWSKPGIAKAQTVNTVRR